MAGRPSTKTPAIMTAICLRIAMGESLYKIAEAEGMPGYSTVMAWLNQDKPFQEQYARAREAQADFIADQCIEIADDKSLDILHVGSGGDIRSLTNSAAVQRAKLQVETRWKKAAQMAPKKWGQQQVQHMGEDGGPVKVTVNVMLKKEPAPS